MPTPPLSPPDADGGAAERGELDTLRRELEELRIRAEGDRRAREEAQKREEEERKAREEAEKREEEERKAREDAEKAKEDAERDFAPVAFPVALARVHSIKDCSSTATKPHVHDYVISPSTRTFEDFGNNEISWRERDDSGRRLASHFNLATRGGPHSTRNEASLTTYVGDVVNDCVQALGLDRWVEINPEVTSLQIRADLWVIYDPDNRPIGTVEVKQHGPLTDRVGQTHPSAVEHPGVLSQVHDQLSHLRHVWGVKQAFGIVTTLRTWRVCWLDDDETNELARERCDDLQRRLLGCGGRLVRDRYSTPEKTQERAGRPIRASPPRTPVAAPTDLENVVVLAKDQPSESDDDGSPEEVRAAPAKLAMSKELEVRKPPEGATEHRDLADPKVMNLVGAALLRMCASELLFDLTEPFKNADVRNFTIVEPGKTYWGKLQVAEGCPAMGRFPRGNAQRLWLVDRVGKGRDGIAHLACTAGARAVCVVKERRARAGVAPLSSEDAKALLDKEQGNWRRVYGDDFSTRVAQWNGTWTLMAPFFSHVSPALRENERVRKAVKTVIKRFADKGVRHNDIAWRNICLYKTAEENDLRAVLIDLADVCDFPEGQDRREWVAGALCSLEESA